MFFDEKGASMSGWRNRVPATVIFGVVLLCLILSAFAWTAKAQSFPRYNHIFLLIMENEGYNQIIGSSYAPILNALAQDYGLATNYRGVADPSEPNYVAMLGGDFFGINSDDPYWFPGHTIPANANGSPTNLMSQLEQAGLTWRGYFQTMPYAGYRGYCYPDKCNGIPDFDTQYVTKHNGIVNFAELQTPAELGKMFPYQQFSVDLAAGTVPNFSYIVPNECSDMHGAPPWCVDSDNTGTVQQSWLIAEGDKFAGAVINQITSSSMWGTGENAIVVVFDEGNIATSQIAAIVITNHGPRGITDKTSYNHYSLLASIQQAFGLGCLVNSCTATPMEPLFAITGSTTIPTLPPPYNFPTSSDTISAQGAGKGAAAVSLTGLTGWTVVPSYSFGSLDNVLAGVAAASPSDAWAVGAYYPSSSNVLATLAEHFDGTRWTAYPLPNVGVQENTLLAVSMPSTGSAWGVGYYLNGKFQQQTLVEHFNGTVWTVVPSPNPGALQNILFGVAAITDYDVWAVGGEQDGSGLWHTLTEHWDGSSWSVVNAVDAGAGTSFMR
jgi:Phosphoesterase family